MGVIAEAPAPPDVLAAIRAPFEAFRTDTGGAWIDPPVLQPLNLLLDLAGEAMRARLFTIQGEGSAELCLRPDFTISIASTHINARAASGCYLYEGKAFRTAPRDSGRAVEFLQIGAEVYGSTADAALQDAEIAALAWRASTAGGRADLGLFMGDVALFAAFLTALGLPDAERARLTRAFATGRGVKRLLAQAAVPASEAARAESGGRLAALLGDLPETEAASVLEELWTLAGIQPTGGRSPAEIVHRLAARADQARGPRLTAAETELISRYLDIIAPPHEALERIESLAYGAKVEFDIQLQPWVRRLKALAAAGVPDHAMIFSTGFMRPFGYYDGMLLEVRSLELGFEQPVAAGGRYDGLPARLRDYAAGGSQVGGAVGCMVRPSRAWAGGRP